jgi:uncharacterized protein
MAKVRRLPGPQAGSVFVDSGPWIALAIRRDQYHTRAVSVWTRLRQERRRLLTTSFVLDEVVTFVRYREGFAPAREIGNRIAQSQLVELVDIDRDLRLRAWELFEQFEHTELSFTDCTSFAVIEAHGSRQVFSFDADFQAAGVELLG